MKEKNKFSHLTLKELQTKQKQLNGAAIGLSIVMVIALIILVGLIIKKENYTLLTFVFLIPVTLLPSFINLSQLNNEIKSRDFK